MNLIQDILKKYPVRDWLIGYIHDVNLEYFAKRYIKGILIDIGCGVKPYKGIMSTLVSEHVGVDHVDGMHSKDNVDLMGTAYSIPCENARFDSAICTAVLEHLEEPSDAIAECGRVLKAGGIAIYSIPHIWNLHEEPRDFFRYTKYGIKHLFEKNGFEIIEMKPLSGFWISQGQMFLNYISAFDRFFLKTLKIFIPIYIFLQLIFIIFEKISFLFKRLDNPHKWAWMYMVVARKK